MIRAMTDADNKMSVNLHENGKQQSRIINSFVAASGTLIIILCSLLDTCSRVLCVSPRSLSLLVSRHSRPSPPWLLTLAALSCPQFVLFTTFYAVCTKLWHVSTVNTSLVMLDSHQSLFNCKNDEILKSWEKTFVLSIKFVLGVTSPQ